MEWQPKEESEPKQLLAHEFIGGIIHRLASRNGGKYVLNVHDRRLHGAFKDTFDYLAEHVEANEVELGFAIYPDRIHGDSETVATELRWLQSLGMVRGYNGSFSRLIYDVANPSSRLHEQIPGIPPELLDELVHVFEASFQEG